MEKWINPRLQDWGKITARPQLGQGDLENICRDIFTEVQKEGDRALVKYTWYFDRVRIGNFRVSEEEIAEAEEEVGMALKDAIREAARNIKAFHLKQLPGSCEYESGKGFRCWQEVRGIERVGLYIPGGSAPLFSTVLMLVIPARIAGCREIVICTPPGPEGRVHPAILWAARYCGATAIYKVGGIQAVAALTLGTETIPRVSKILGPGNQYVTAAKRFAGNYRVAMDMPAGPSEVLIVADSTARPEFLAADLLSQAEHGKDSQVVLVTWCPDLLEKVERETERQMEMLPRCEIARAAWANARFVVLETPEMCMRFVNEYAPEHLLLSVENCRDYIADIRNAGSVFLGNYSPESAGDYASGTNHTLPTGAFAKAYSGINVDAFLKKISFQEISEEGLRYLAPVIMTMAEQEHLYAHKNAVQIRINNIGTEQKK